MRSGSALSQCGSANCWPLGSVADARHDCNQPLHLADKLLLHKRALIETILDQLKNVCRIEHSRHRSSVNILVHLLAGLVT